MTGGTSRSSEDAAKDSRPSSNLTPSLDHSPGSMSNRDSEADFEKTENDNRERLQKASLTPNIATSNQNILEDSGAPHGSGEHHVGNAKNDSRDQLPSVTGGGNDCRSNEPEESNVSALMPRVTEGDVKRDHNQSPPSHLSASSGREEEELGYRNIISQTQDTNLQMQVEPSLEADPAPKISASYEERKMRAEQPMETVQTPAEQGSISARSSLDKPEGAISPRKKRSREQLDNEADRQQKIVATEEARALRFSKENETLEDIAGTTDASDPATKSIEDGRQADSSAPKSAFGIHSDFGQILRNSGDTGNSGQVGQQITSPSAFASSGFATMASKADSPFTSLASQSGAFKAPASAGRSSSDLQIDSGSLRHPQHIPLASGLKSGNIGVFGGSVLGQGFSSGRSFGNKLSSFAAPNGDADLDGYEREVKPIGSESATERVQSSNGSEDEESRNRNPGEDFDSDERFRSQDIETGESGENSLFTSRASLYAFRDNIWKESGKGVFKFNIADGSATKQDQISGRFIMRAHQTYRVLLNAPLFEGMQVGDSKGNEPVAKSFAFAVIEDGRPIPHMVKLADVAEAQSLYQAVKKLQQKLI